MPSFQLLLPELSLSARICSQGMGQWLGEGGRVRTWTRSLDWEGSWRASAHAVGLREWVRLGRGAPCPSGIAEASTCSPGSRVQALLVPPYCSLGTWLVSELLQLLVLPLSGERGRIQCGRSSILLTRVSFLYRNSNKAHLPYSLRFEDRV